MRGVGCTGDSYVAEHPFEPPLLEVVFAGWKSGYTIVILDHGDFQTKYAHNSENLVRAEIQ